MRFVNPFEAVPLNELGDPAKTRLHVVREPGKFLLSAVIEHFYDPRQFLRVLQFCNVRKPSIQSLP